MGIIEILHEFPSSVWIGIHSLLRLIGRRGSADIIALYYAYHRFAADALYWTSQIMSCTEYLIPNDIL